LKQVSKLSKNVYLVWMTFYWRRPGKAFRRSLLKRDDEKYAFWLVEGASTYYTLEEEAFIWKI
jgi:hypothetical protein